MRRPGPLPAPEERAAERTGRRPLADPEGLVPLEDEPRRRALVVPFRRRDRDEAEPDAPEQDEPAGAPRGTGWRDVWRATRARRRALRSEIRRFTVRSRRRRMIWIGSISALLLLVIGSVGAAYSPLFAVQRISVVGAEKLDDDALQEALSAQVGRPLPLVDHAEIKAALVEFPLIETYTLEARPPHDLVVKIVERTPIGVVRSDAGFTVVDAAGVVLSTTEAQPEDQPLIDARDGLDSPAFAAVGQVLRSLPEDVHGLVVGARATTQDDVTLTLRDGTEVLWGSAEKSALKARTLLAAPDGKSFYDVSSPGVLIFR
ncbi:FtsQ-type POTRA domain-containing protein [Microbacterium paludicola]|uniref:FtsQ-type POTRA domain-containing protein n=1 Tax=Microbacterium paludicola TaxID=300019 RepID=A0A4Y9FXT6_9MICO|nr:FtsQ-type POTRA domain-containing protein [Microbacterium paludicola]MBF0815311.1 FtsQ-type POTRA domain-containing protein [Microbacterium paludicola]TFU34171.1 FtsQ-type POTRA domain-containing protein [Microbacterium paludicola]